MARKCGTEDNKNNIRGLDDMQRGPNDTMTKKITEEAWTTRDEAPITC